MSPLRPIDGAERDELLIEAEIEHIETRFHRRQRMYLVVMAALVITSVTLALLNVRLASRVSALQSASPGAAVAGAESKPIVPNAEAATSEPAVTIREPQAREPAASRRDARATEREARTTEPAPPGREPRATEPASLREPRGIEPAAGERDPRGNEPGAAEREPGTAERAARRMARASEAAPAIRDPRANEPVDATRELRTSESATPTRPRPSDPVLPAREPGENQRVAAAIRESNAPAPGVAAAPQRGTGKPIATRRAPDAGVLESLTEPRTAELSTPGASGDASERVAKWMIEAYGKRSAERQLEDALKFYQRDDERSRHWRRVLGHVRTAQDL
jgi:hypothetical protein